MGMIVGDESGPFVPARIMVKTVKEDKDVVPILEPPPVAATIMFPDTSIDKTKSIVNPLLYCTRFKEIKRTRKEREREREAYGRILSQRRKHLPTKYRTGW